MAADSPSGCDVLLWIRDMPATTGRWPGQVQDIKDCPHRGYGQAEAPPDFKRIHIPDRREADLQWLKQKHREFWPNTAEEGMMRLREQTKIVLRRRYHIDLNALAAADKLAIVATNGDAEIELAWAKLSGKHVDDRGTILEHQFAWRDRTEELDRRHALIIVGLMPAPPDYVLPLRSSIQDAVAALDAEIASRIAGGEWVPPVYIPPDKRTP